MLLRAARLRARARLVRRGQRGLALLAQSVRARLAGGAPGGGGRRLYERSTDDADVCGLACVGNATRCAAACWRERARLHGWAGPAPTADEAACTRDCGPRSPRCVRECAWAGETPNPASCSRACGPFEPQCVHACVAAREAAAEGDRPEAAAAAAAAASAETAAPVRASAAPPPPGGDAAVCARAWSRGRARRRARGRCQSPLPASVPFTRR